VAKVIPLHTILKMADSISIEETNKIRVAIGLKPLPVPGAGPVFKESQDSDSDSDSSDASEEASTLETRTAASYENYKKVQDEADAKKKREAKNAAIKRARDLAKRDAKLEGSGLGDAPEGELDTRTWLMQQKKRQKKLEKERARKLEEELAERERQAEYTEKDLAGVRVAHEVGDFDDGDQVLVLKDTTIDENEEEGDELENVDLRDREKLNERMQLKKRKPVYDPNDDDGTGEKSILAHYDEEIDGKKRKRFTLDGQGATAEEREAKKQEVSTKLKAQSISLDFFNDAPTSDYIDVSEVKIRKPKKKKAKPTRQKAADDDDVFPTIESMPAPNASSMDVDTENGKSVPPKPKQTETSLVDDDDLQASLALQRRAALKKRKKLRPEEIARQLREEESATPAGMEVDPTAEDEAEEPGLVIDETSEFVANLQRPTIPTKRKSITKTAGTPEIASPDAQEDGDADVQMSYNNVEDEEELLARVKRDQSNGTPDMTSTGLDDESSLNQGVGAAFALLRQRGLVKTSADGDINALHRDRQRFLAEKQRLENDAERRARVQRERDRASGKLDRMSAREREQHAQWENKQRDQQDSRQIAEIFNKEYKPDVNLKYIDEHGRSMNQKEAFKALSHQFHGKGSGKQKTEKHLKKIEDEKRREAQSTLDSSTATGMNNAMKTTAGKNRQAGVRLA
jgi:U4/U6.U5 tri-snRNP-associated protein 1